MVPAIETEPPENHGCRKKQAKQCDLKVWIYQPDIEDIFNQDQRPTAQTVPLVIPFLPIRHTEKTFGIECHKILYAPRAIDHNRENPDKKNGHLVLRNKSKELIQIAFVVFITNNASFHNYKLSFCERLQ